MLTIAIVMIVILTYSNRAYSFITKSSIRSNMKLKDLINDIDVKIILKNTLLQNKKLSLLYKASRDGWNAKDFHRKCDCGLPSLILMKSAGTNIFNRNRNTSIVGGYNPFGWSSVDDYKNSKNCFLFVYNSNNYYISKKKDTAEGAIYDFGNVGPSFGLTALSIPLNPSKIANKKAAVSNLGSDYTVLQPLFNNSKNNNNNYASLFGISDSVPTNKVTLSELELYVDAAKDSSIIGDIGAGIDDNFSWGGYGA